ncbi:acetyltransferase [Streptomyces sp. NBC_01387]|uniref:acetyltransferase n=1 Tax=unclassified Streptomyces TaxID=2593676 RepID=UPI0020243FDF|nr:MULTISPECIES: acetyltransferase [unclassified Streptomyces]WSV54712.1 acetyltransferase [Streptomyces sp. NBC_01014]
MRQFIKRSAVLAAAVGAFAAIGIVPASAATATPASICGSGYRQIDSHIFTNGRVEFARVFLLYDAATGYNCVVTQHSKATAGMPLTTGAWLDVQGDGKGQVKNQGTFTSYAGPVRLKAVHSCVKWGGMIEAGVGTYTYTSPWEHCG